VYWTLLLLGEQDYYTFEGNWLHDVSGRAPHMGTDHTSSQIFFHGMNNYFQDLSGHAFDIDTNTWVLLEGNYFANVNTPLTEASLTAGHYAVADVPAKVVANAGVGKLQLLLWWILLDSFLCILYRLFELADSSSAFGDIRMTTR